MSDTVKFDLSSAEQETIEKVIAELPLEITWRGDDAQFRIFDERNLEGGVRVEVSNALSVKYTGLEKIDPEKYEVSMSFGFGRYANELVVSCKEEPYVTLRFCRK